MRFEDGRIATHILLDTLKTTIGEKEKKLGH
jgi:hypothetical protein